MGRVSAELGAKVYLDTNIVIYAVEGFANLAAQIQALLQAMDEAQTVAVTSELTLAEALIKPLKDQNQPPRPATTSINYQVGKGGKRSAPPP